MYERPFTRKIIEELDYFCSLAKENFGYPEWTAGVKNALLRTGRHFGCQVNTTINPELLPEELQQECKDNPPDFGEWLYDVSIWDITKSSERWCMPVVAECEWKANSWIKEDFEKLLVARAALRVMVYEDSFIKEPEELLQWVDLHEGSQAGDTYLLAAYQDTKTQFHYRHIVVQPFGAKLVKD